MKRELVAVILAGGVGKRFWPLSTNKALFPFAGKPSMYYVLEQLPLAGIKEAIVVTNPNNREAVSRLSVSGVNITVVIQPTPNGMAGAVLAAKDEIHQRSMLVINAEDLVDDKLYETIRSEIQKQKPFVTGRKITKYFDAGYLKLRGDNVEAIIEKPGKGNEPSGYTNLVFHYFPDSSLFLKLLETTTSDRDDTYEQALSGLFKTIDFHVVPYEGIWVPLKYPWHVLDFTDVALERLSPHRGKNVEIRSNVVIEGDVVFGDNVKVFENTKIVGPCYIGGNTIIGNNNIIRRSHVGPDCVTGFGSDITRSYIGDNCWLHSNYIGDSVLEGEVAMGAGSVLANLRLDDAQIYSKIGEDKIATGRTKLGAIIGRGVRIGVNASVMPGIKIGGNSYLGAGIVLDKDLLDGSYCMGKTAYAITKNTRTPGASREDFRKQLR